MVSNFIKSKILNPLLSVIKQGITAEKLALSLALGMSISISPLLFGFTTFLCAIVAGFLKLNQVAIQVANYIVYPLQLILIIPFMSLGEKLLSNNSTELSIEILKQYISAGPKEFMIKFGTLFLYGTLIWLVIAPVLAAILYFSLLPITRFFIKKYS